jgi:SNF2 family DNA or RNA helicase
MSAKMPLQSQSEPTDRDNKSAYEDILSVAKPEMEDSRSTQPLFGKPSLPGVSSQPYRRPQPLTQPVNTTASRQINGSRQDKDSDLFISKSGQRKPEFHEPRQHINPLHQIKNNATQPARERVDGPKPVSTSASQSLVQGPSRPATKSLQTTHDDGYDVVEIPRPTNMSKWTPKPVPQTIFSSTAYSNPFYTNKNFVDLTTPTTGMATNRDLFDDRFGASDPSNYLDAAKANENIKALLEGALEDEDDKPQTCRRKKQIEKESEDVVDKLKGMNVKEEAKAEDEEDEEDDGTVEGLKVKLLPHQIEGVAWMRDKELGTKKTRGVLPKGGILADDMGLGKTIQSIALMLTNPKPSDTELESSKRKLPPNLEKSTLVIAPLALIKQWEGEIKDRVEDSHAMRVLVHHGPQRTKDYKALRKYDVVITTYQTLSSEHTSSGGKGKVGCFGLNWYRVILDEAHSIKNRNAKATKAVCDLEAEYRWCLTGTPMQNNLDELQSLIHFLRIKPYEDLNAWRDQITRPMNNGRGGLAIKRLQVYLKAFMKRRTKEILKQEGALKNGNDDKPGQKTSGFKIVARTVEQVEAEFTPEEREFYQRLETRADKRLQQMISGNNLSYANALVLLLRLRQACNHPQLISGSLAKDQDSLTNGSGSQTSSQRKTTVEDMDSIADMLGGLSVETKKCDVCQVDLTAEDVSRGAIRCAECEADVEEQGRKTDMRRKMKEKKSKRIQQVKAQRKQKQRIIEESDEDDDESDGDEDEESEEDEDYDSDDATSNLVSSTKIRHLLSLLRHDAHTHKYIVFSFFTSMLDLIEPFLRRSLPHIAYTRYDGSMRNDAREAALTQLRTNPKCRILLCSLRAGSLGLNLTAASRVVILEPFWNPFVEEQAIDRVHRLNQTQDVKIFKLTVSQTVESRILELQEKKRELAAATIEGKMAASKLTLQDMLKLFRREAEVEHGVDGVGMRERGALLREGDSVLGGSGQVRQEKRKEHQVYGRRW